jgi:uncharacterized membrane protein
MIAFAVCVFGSAGDAERAVRLLENLRPGQVIGVHDAAVVSWPPGQRKPTTWQVGGLGGGTALTGAFWGLLFGIVFLLPLAGPVGSADGSLTQLGLDPDFLAPLRQRITAGRSALFLLVPQATTDRLAEVIAGEVLVTALTPQQQQGLLAAFGEGD